MVIISAVGSPQFNTRRLYGTGKYTTNGIFNGVPGVIQGYLGATPRDFPHYLYCNFGSET